jgi:hypothetical protein
MKRKASIDLTTAMKKLRISRKGTNRLAKIKKGKRPPSYGVKRSLNFTVSARDKKLLGLK